MVQSYPLKADGSPSNLDKPCAINVSLNNMEVTSCQQAQITNLNISQSEGTSHSTTRQEVLIIIFSMVFIKKKQTNKQTTTKQQNKQTNKSYLTHLLYLNDLGTGLEVATSEGVSKQWLVSIHCGLWFFCAHACTHTHTHTHTHTPAYDSEHNSVDDFADTPQFCLSYPLQLSLQVLPIKYLHRRHLQ